MEKYLKQFENCRQGEKPFCTSTCPFHVDVLDFQQKLGRNNYNSAYKTYRNAVGFPEIVSELCPEYCAASCPRKDLDQAVQLSLLEKTCLAKATKKDPTDYNLPVKNQKIGIIGAGISGLACALRLCSKKYNVTIYEKTDRLGGQLWNLLPQDIFLEDIHRQFQFENYTLHFNTEIKNIDELRNEGFDAIYIATGKDGTDFGALNHENGHCYLAGDTPVFAGGSLIGKDIMHALADGLDMSWAIELYFKTGRLQYPEIGQPSKAVANPDKLIITEAIKPTDHGIFTDEEVTAEANRCIRCQCDACRTYCDLSAYHNKWPLMMRDEILSTVSASESMLHKTPAIRLINTCTQCNLCEETCPENIQIGEMIKEARYMLHQQNKTPGAYHQFWLNDLEFANGEFAALKKKAPGQEECNYAFFPGCHLGAANPDYVIEPYQWLLSKDPKTGLLLRCCGVPAEWSGNEEMHKGLIDDLRKDWEQLGKPVLIMACPSCTKHFKEYLPEIETISLYERLEEGGAQWKSVALEQTYSVFDPCTARNIIPVQQAVRKLAKDAGVSFEELPKGDKHGCCGFGGHGSTANSDFTDYVTKNRAELSENPYLVYCINCRDIFREKEKPVLHILDLLFNIDIEGKELPNITERRNNRVILKERLLNEIWEEKMESKPEKCKLNLIIKPEIQEKMNTLKIFEEDICNVLEFCKSINRRTFDPQKETYSCYREIGYITYWVEYRLVGEDYEIVNVYTHRLKIELEAVWNGRKTEVNL